MKVLVVYAHPNPESFNHAILEEFTKGLKGGGHTFRVVDLYAIRFNPCLKLEDFAQFSRGQIPRDVLDQQEKVTQAEALVFIYPVWWWSFPAILKGWFDRVLGAPGFAGKLVEPPMIMEGLLKHKKALLINTAMDSKAGYEASGVEDSMRKVMVDLSLKYTCGIQNVEHVFLYEVNWDAEARKRYLKLAYRLGKEF